MNTFNIGVDFSSKNRRIGGSFEYFNKHAKHLIGPDYLPPNTGVSTNGTATLSNLINYANLKTKGWDLQFNTRWRKYSSTLWILKKRIKLEWLFSFSID